MGHGAAATRPVAAETEAMVRLADDLKQQMAEIREQMNAMQRQMSEQRHQEEKCDVKDYSPAVQKDEEPIQYIPYPDLSNIVFNTGPVEYPHVPEFVDVGDLPPILGRSEEKAEEVKVDDGVFYPPPREAVEEDRPAYYAPPGRRAIPMV
jgi:hypothetical protein